MQFGVLCFDTIGNLYLEFERGDRQIYFRISMGVTFCDSLFCFFNLPSDGKERIFGTNAQSTAPPAALC